MAKIEITYYYAAYANHLIEIPAGYTADDIDDITSKWGQSYLHFTDGRCLQLPQHEAELDHKRPTDIGWNFYPDGEELGEWLTTGVRQKLITLLRENKRLTAEQRAQAKQWFQDLEANYEYEDTEDLVGGSRGDDDTTTELTLAQYHRIIQAHKSE